MNYREFRCFVLNTISIVSADLDELELIAERANETSRSSSLTIQTTKRPEDQGDCDDMTVDISRCTIPMAMVCFSIIDMIGQWLKKIEDSDFRSSASIFFKDLVDRHDLINDAALERFKEDFRNGIMHSFFAKKGFAVTYAHFEGNSLFIEENGNANILDVRYLIKIVRLGLETILNNLDNEEFELSKRLYNGYLRWIAKN